MPVRSRSGYCRGSAGVGSKGEFVGVDVKADLDQLERLGKVLHALAGEAGALKTGAAAGPYLSTPGGMMPSVLAAAAISSDLIDGALVSAIKERLGETGDVMGYVAKQFRNQDQASADQIVSVYSNATGDWDAAEPNA